MRPTLCAPNETTLRRKASESMHMHTIFGQFCFSGKILSLCGYVVDIVDRRIDDESQFYCVSPIFALIQKRRRRRSFGDGTLPWYLCDVTPDSWLTRGFDQQSGCLKDMDIIQKNGATDRYQYRIDLMLKM